MKNSLSILHLFHPGGCRGGTHWLLRTAGSPTRHTMSNSTPEATGNLPLRSVPDIYPSHPDRANGTGAPLYRTRAGKTGNTRNTETPANKGDTRSQSAACTLSAVLQRLLAWRQDRGTRQCKQSWRTLLTESSHTVSSPKESCSASWRWGQPAVKIRRETSRLMITSVPRNWSVLRGNHFYRGGRTFLPVAAAGALAWPRAVQRGVELREVCKTWAWPNSCHALRTKLAPKNTLRKPLFPMATQLIVTQTATTQVLMLSPFKWACIVRSHTTCIFFDIIKTIRQICMCVWYWLVLVTLLQLLCCCQSTWMLGRYDDTDSFKHSAKSSSDTSCMTALPMASATCTASKCLHITESCLLSTVYWKERQLQKFSAFKHKYVFLELPLTIYAVRPLGVICSSTPPLSRMSRAGRRFVPHKYLKASKCTSLMLCSPSASCNFTPSKIACIALSISLSPVAICNHVTYKMSVIEGLIVQIINRAAGSFVKDVDSSKLSASLWSGKYCHFFVLCVLLRHGSRVHTSWLALNEPPAVMDWQMWRSMMIPALSLC